MEFIFFVFGVIVTIFINQIVYTQLFEKWAELRGRTECSFIIYANAFQGSSSEHISDGIKEMRTLAGKFNSFQHKNFFWFFSYCIGLSKEDLSKISGNLIGIANRYGQSTNVQKQVMDLEKEIDTLLKRPNKLIQKCSVKYKQIKHFFNPK